MARSKDSPIENENKSVIEMSSDDTLRFIVGEGSYTQRPEVIMGKLSRCNKRFNNLFKPDLDKRAAEQLLQYVLFGNFAKAEAMIQAKPQLLTMTATATDYAGRTIKGTALQLAMGAEDIKCHDDEEAMTEMVMRYLKTLPDGESIIANQINQQFPAGWEEQEKTRAESDLAALNHVIDAIANSQSNEECAPALQAFRDYLEQQAKQPIKTGKHFNIDMLVEAFKLYEEKFEAFGGFNSRKNKLFWYNVIGYTQRFLPACYAQAFCQGLYDIAFTKKKLERSLNFKNGGDIFFPLDRNPAFRLGHDYAGAYWPTAERGLSWSIRSLPSGGPLSVLANKKHDTCRTYIPETAIGRPQLFNPVR